MKLLTFKIILLNWSPTAVVYCFKQLEMEAEGKWKGGKIYRDEGEGSKDETMKEDGKIIQEGERREKPHSRDKCPHHGLEDCISALQHASRP